MGKCMSKKANNDELINASASIPPLFKPHIKEQNQINDKSGPNNASQTG